MADLYFDIASDLSDDLSLVDYFHFLLINDLTSDIRYDMTGITRRVEYYRNTLIQSPRYFLTNHVRDNGDIEVLDWLLRNTNEFFHNWFQIPVKDQGGELRNLEVIKWLYDNGIVCSWDFDMVSRYGSPDVQAFIGEDGKNDE